MPTDTSHMTEVSNGTIVALSRDLFFGMRMRTIIRQLGYSIQLIKDESSLVDVAMSDAPLLAFVDFNQSVDWDALAPLISSDIPIVGFGSHTYVEGFRAAKAAGVDRVVSNGEFSRSLPDLIEKYRKN